MRMATWLVLLILVSTGSLSAQPTSSARVVAGTERRPVPYAAVGVLGQSRGTYADELGRFTLDGLRSSDSLRVSSVGYRPKTVSVSHLGNPAEITLNEVPTELATIPIRREAGTVRRVGSRRSEGANGFYVSLSRNNEIHKNEIALFLPGSTDAAVTYLKTVGFFVSDTRKPKAPFRVRVYAAQDGKPGTNLLTHSLVTAARRGGAWHDVDVQEFNIRVPPEGIFVGMEWLYGSQRKFFTHSTFYPKYPDRSLSETLVYYGQALAATPEFDTLQSYRRAFGGWTLNTTPPGFGVSNANPMIRAECLVYEN